MSTAQALRNLERDIGAELDKDIGPVANQVRGKVAELKRSMVSRYVAPDPESEQDRFAAIHRSSIAKRKQRIADTKKGLKATLASIAAERKEEKARHNEALSILSNREDEAKAQADKDMDADKRIVASCEAALEILTSE